MKEWEANLELIKSLEERIDALEKNIPANQELFRSALVGRQELDKRIEKLEHDRDAIVGWARQADEILIVKPKEDKPTNEILINSAHGKAPIPYKPMNSESYREHRIHTIDAQKEEIEHLKSDLEDSQKLSNQRAMRLISKCDIIEQALEQVSIEETTERTGTLINGIKTVQIDVMEFYKILNKFKAILEGSK